MMIPRLTERHLSEYSEQGFTVLRGLFEREEVDLVRAVCERDPEIARAHRTFLDKNGRPWGAAVWTGVNDSLVSVLTRTARMVEAAELLVGERCYHWHSKLVQKAPYDKSVVDWHQGYHFWYGDGCLFPNFASCTIAITDATKDNGCLQFVKRSHLMGRIEHVKVQNDEVCDPQRMEQVCKALEVVDCEMEAGDAVFFHANAIHGSLENRTDANRILMHCHYNAVSNHPIFGKIRESHPCIPLEKVPDSALKDGFYKGGFYNNSPGFEWYTSDDESS